MPDRKKDTFQIRNSTVDFLVFTKDAHEDGIEVRVQDQDVWLTQKAIAQLFEVDRSVVTKHLKNVYESGELSEAATCANFAQVADNGKTYRYKFYALSAIIAVGYRVNSGRATEFRQWATKVLSTFTRQGADHTKEHMGLTSWRNAPDGKIVKADVSVAKNYLSVDEMQELNEIVTMYLDYATRQARRHIPMTMADWASKLDAFLQFNDAEVLRDKGKVTAAIAKAFAESEFEQYRVLQDRLYQSDFDRLMARAEGKDES